MSTQKSSLAEFSLFEPPQKKLKKIALELYASVGAMHAAINDIKKVNFFPFEKPISWLISKNVELNAGKTRFNKILDAYQKNKDAIDGIYYDLDDRLQSLYLAIRHLKVDQHIFATVDSLDDLESTVHDLLPDEMLDETESQNIVRKSNP